MNALELRRRTLGKGVYKKTVEGNPAIAQGSLARRYPGITMQGWTEQAQYEGKNLFDISKITPGDTGGSNITIDGEKIIVTNGPESSGVYPKEPNSLLQYCPNIVAGKSYTLKFDTTGTNKNIYIQGYGAWDSGQTLNITEQILSSKIAFYASGPDTSATISNFMINEGSSALTYEPYTGGQPSPNPDYPQAITSAGKYDEGAGKWKYEVKLTGANLFNPDGEIADESLYDGIPLNNKGIVSMALYEKNQDVDVSNIYFGMCSDELNSNNVGWAMANGAIQTGGKIIVSNDNRYVCWYPGKDTVLQKVLSRYDVMVNYGDGVYLPYQPYKEQSVTLTADRPLTKWDKLEKRNGQWGWVYKSDEIESYTDESVPGEYFSTTGQLSTGAQVWYETTTETFVPLSEAEQEAMNALYTFRPTTVLSNDCECEMTLTYKTKKSLEVTT